MRTLTIPLSIVLCAAVVFTSPATVARAQSDGKISFQKQEKRFMGACRKRNKKEHVCRCFFAAGAGRHSPIEIEMMIANVVGDTSKQAAVKKHPDFNANSYNDASSGIMTAAIASIAKQRFMR